jgi:hypothetical protein
MKPHERMRPARIWRSHGPQLFPKNAPDKRNDRFGRPATMHANNAYSSVAQAFDVDAEWGL